LCLIQPQLERTTLGPHSSADLLHLRRQRKGLRAEEVDLKILMRVDTKVPLANRHKNHRLHDGVRVEVVKFKPIVVQDHLHEAARRHPKPLLME
jgi:hypothetical protein